MPAALDMAEAGWPEFGLCDDIRPALLSAMERGHPAGLVTLYHATGGAPRGLGAQMLVTEHAVAGYLSGGCIEADVTRHALAVIASGEPRRLVYGDGGPVDIRLPCGGRIDLLVERVPADDAAGRQLTALSARREPALWLSDGLSRLCLSEGARIPDDNSPFKVVFAATRQALSQAGTCRTGNIVYRRFQPRPRFVVLGRDPTVLAMASLARQAGMDVVLVRPRGPAAPPLAGIRYLRSRPAEALESIGLDPWTAVAVALHQDEDDHEALVTALPSKAGYVGLLGSARHLPQKLARLAEAGISAQDRARLCAPIGLDVGHAPWPIAIGVMAEILQTMRAVRGEQSCPRKAAAA